MPMFRTPSIGPLPSAPPPAPLLPDTTGAANSQVEAAKKAAGQFGFGGTILTGPSGTSAPATGDKKLYGQ